ncbi:hypothetical protein AAE478_009538 [Parahypoxylon ruwenzoriense]
MSHYRRDNASPVTSGEYAWRLSGTVNGVEDKGFGRVVARNAAPLFQSAVSGGDSAGGVTILETVLLSEDGNAFHYRCTQTRYRPNGVSHSWILACRIASLATGPVCLYQGPDGTLRALVPQGDNIAQYIFNGSTRWNIFTNISNTCGPACVFVPNPLDRKISLVVRHNDRLCLSMEEFKPNWTDLQPPPSSVAELPVALTRLFRGHRPQGNPMAIVSQSMIDPGYFSNPEAIVFHPCGTGWQDSWMVLHWTYLILTKEWIVSGVVLQAVDGLPM